MSINATVVGLPEVKEYLNRLPANVYEQAKEAMRTGVFEVHRRVSDRVRDGSGGSLHSRTGQLRRSLQARVSGTTLDTLGGEVYSDGTVASYAPTHEWGATIKAKDKYVRVPGGPYLNIPLTANKTPAGVMRQDARTVFQQGGYIIKSRANKYLVMSSTGLPMFVLVKEVTIPPRLQMVKMAEDYVPTLLSDMAAATGRGIQ